MVIPQKPGRDYSPVFLFIMILIVSIIRYRYITIPLERDEGEYAYIGNLLLHGEMPFKDAYSMKLPGTAFMYAFIMLIFGHTGTGIHWGLLFMNAGTMVLLYSVFKKMFSPFIGLVTATIYGLMATGIPFLGFAAHATQFICFYFSIALLVLTNYMKSGKTLTLLLLGLILGMTFLMKQQAIFLILFAVLFLFVFLLKKHPGGKTSGKPPFIETVKKMLLLGSGIAFPYILTFIFIICAGQFPEFWLWTVKYASQYERVKSLTAIFLYFRVSFEPTWYLYSYLWVLALAGLVALFMGSYTRMQKIFVAGYFLFAACAVSSGFYFRPHYYVVILPVLGLLIGILIETSVKALRKRMPVLKSPNALLVSLSMLVLIITYTNWKYFFTYPAYKVCDMSYWGNPFSVVPEISRYIKDNTSDTDKIAVLGSEPEIYFYANRKAATGYLYTYPLVDQQSYNKIMQQQMIAEIEKNKPSMIVYCNIIYSWIVQPGTPRDIFDWGNSYTHSHYTPVAFIDFFNNEGWYFFWGADIKKRNREPQSFIILFKRNADTTAVHRPL